MWGDASQGLLLMLPNMFKIAGELSPAVFHQAREALNPFADAVPGIVAGAFARLAERTGRRYRLVEYTGAPDAERVVVLLGSGSVPEDRSLFFGLTVKENLKLSTGRRGIETDQIVDYFPAVAPLMH